MFVVWKYMSHTKHSVFEVHCCWQYLHYSHISEKSNTFKKSKKAHRRRWLTLYNEWPSLHVFSYNKCMFYPYKNHPCNSNCDSQVSLLPHVSCHPMRRTINHPRMYHHRPMQHRHSITITAFIIITQCYKSSSWDASSICMYHQYFKYNYHPHVSIWCIVIMIMHHILHVSHVVSQLHWS